MGSFYYRGKRDMRRKDREIKDLNKVKEIIAASHCCRLGFRDGERVYIVPMNFGFTEEEGKFVFYFHSAREGHKLDLIRENGVAGFELDTNYQLIEADIACEYTARFQSVIGSGKIEIIEEEQEKRKGLLEVMKQSTGRTDWEFPDQMVNAVTVFKLTVSEYACKEHE